MAIEGPLRELGIQDVLQLLELAHKTGILTVRSERHNDEGVIHLDRGEIVFARRRRSRRLLGQQLLRAGKLTERELERALELQRANPSQRLSEVFLEMASAEERDLLEQIRFQVEENVYDMMAWDEGYFRFEERSDVFRSRLAVRVRVESLLMEGARRIDEWSRLESRIPGLESVPTLAPAEDGGDVPLDLRPEEWEVLAEIDGARDVRQIAADLGRATFDVGKTIYGLVSMGVAAVKEKAANVPERELRRRMGEAEALLAAGQAERSERIVTELEAAHPGRADLTLLMGRCLAGAGRMRAATEAFDRAVSLDPLTPAGHYHLGFAAVKIGELDRAAEGWTMYLRLAPQSPEREKISRGLEAIRALLGIIDSSSGEDA